MDPHKRTRCRCPVHKILTLYEPGTGSNLSCIYSCIIICGRIRRLEPEADLISEDGVYTADFI